jgi:hypothetical protein
MKCFVISPIGQPNSRVREHADDVYECVIAPALQMTGVSGRRADHVKDVGRISEQMFDDILTADFCIGILAGFNPNVFYEIAVAHSAGIPVLLLCEKGVTPPFDLKDERAFQYDLSPRPIHRGDNPRALAELIESVRKLEGRRRVPFGDNLAPLGGKAGGPDGIEFKPENMQAASDWARLIDGVQHRLWISAFGLTGWKGIDGMTDCLRRLAERNCEVRILTIDESNPALPMMMNPEISGSEPDAMAARVAAARSWFKQTLSANPRAEVRSIRRGLPLQQIIVTDDAISWSPYFYAVNPMHAPRIDVNSTAPLFPVVLKEFEALWAANAAAVATDLSARRTARAL